MEQVIILGSGPAGLTSALYAARAELAPLVLGGDNVGGQLMWTSEVENFPGFPEGITGPELMLNMQKQAKKFGARIEHSLATDVDFSDPECLKVSVGEKVYETKSVILAMGASHRWLGVPGEEEFKNRGVTACATCDGAFFRDKNVVVVGGGDAAIEEATFLTRFAKHVTVIVRGPELRASKVMIERAEKDEKISFLWNTNVTEVFGGTVMEGVSIVNNKTKETGKVEANGLFVAIGLVPNTSVLEGHLEMEKGYIVTHNHTETSVKGVFAAGDVQDWRYRQAITSAGFGCMAALDVEKYLAHSE